MSEIRLAYGSGQIKFSEFSEKWIASIDGEIIGERASLKEAKRLIEKHGEDEKSLKRHTALYRRGYGSDQNFETVTVTSYPENGWRGAEAWVTKANKRREKVTISDLREDCPKNHVLVSEIKSLREQIEALTDKINKAEGKLQHYTKRSIEDGGTNEKS